MPTVFWKSVKARGWLSSRGFWGPELRAPSVSRPYPSWAGVICQTYPGRWRRRSRKRRRFRAPSYPALRRIDGVAVVARRAGNSVPVARNFRVSLIIICDPLDRVFFAVEALRAQWTAAAGRPLDLGAT